MNLRKTWQRTALWLGIGWSILWSIVLAVLPLIQQLNLTVITIIVKGFDLIITNSYYHIFNRLDSIN